MHTPRTTLASWSGAAGAELEPLGDAHRAFVLGSSVLHADETPVPMLDPGAGKTKRAYIWGYARSEFDGLRGVVYDFSVGRGAKYPAAFLAGWNGTLVCDDYKVYEPVFKLGKRVEAGCLVHARQKFEGLIKNGHASPVAEEAIRRMGWIFWIEKQARAASPADRLAIRHDQTRGHWDKLHDWLRTVRALVPDGSGIAAAIDYTLNRWVPLGGSELAGKRAATVMSAVQSARMHGHDPWLYLRDVLSRLPTHPARDIGDDGLRSVSRLSGIVARMPAAGHKRPATSDCFADVQSRGPCRASQAIQVDLSSWNESAMQRGKRAAFPKL